MIEKILNKLLRVFGYKIKRLKLNQPANASIQKAKIVGDGWDSHIEIPVANSSVNFYIPPGSSKSRAKSLLIKEPDTIEWIDGMNAGDFLWDIGANIGCYSLYASKIKKVPVLAFEPQSGSYHYLIKNVALNELQNLISAYPIAFASQTKLGVFYLESTLPVDIGGSGHQFEVQPKANDSVHQLTQPTLGFSIDDFIKIYQPSCPSHIKIDVDGIELQILKGATTLLNNTALKSILIELNNESNHCLELLSSHGFNLSSQYKNNHIFNRSNNDV